MKKLFFKIAILFLSGEYFCQPYGQFTFAHSGAFLSSGDTTQQHSVGFLLAGYIPSTGANSPSFYVDKTNPALVTSGPTAFSRDYTMKFNSGCAAGVQTQLQNSNGIS